MKEAEEFIKGELAELHELPKIIKFCKTNKLHYDYDIRSEFKQLEIKLNSEGGCLRILGSSGFTLQNVVDGIVDDWQLELKENGIRKYAKMVR